MKRGSEQEWNGTGLARCTRMCGADRINRPLVLSGPERDGRPKHG